MLVLKTTPQGAFRSTKIFALVFIQAEISPFEEFDPEIGQMLHDLEWL